jgi:hypothetical protein
MHKIDIKLYIDNELVPKIVNYRLVYLKQSKCNMFTEQN